MKAVTAAPVGAGHTSGGGANLPVVRFVREQASAAARAAGTSANGRHRIMGTAATLAHTTGMLGRLFLIASFVSAGIACGGVTFQPGNGSDGGSTGDDSGSGGKDIDAAVASLQKCEGPGTCILSATGCCGLTCGYSSVSQLVAIEWQKGDALRNATCDADGPVPCPGCAQAMDPNWQAFCRANECVGIDVRTDAISACTTDADCTLRYATCCQSCTATSGGPVVAVASTATLELQAQLCLPNSAPCPHCMPQYPTNVKAVCDPSTHHCAVVKQ
jgi:hypothetical protein